MTTAAKELGWSDAEIAHSQKMASLFNPGDGPDQPLVFKPGMDARMMIDSLKQVLLKMKQFTPRQQKEFMEALEKRQKQSREKN